MPRMLGVIVVLVASPEVDSVAHKGSCMQVLFRYIEELLHAAIVISAKDILSQVQEGHILRWRSIIALLVLYSR